MLVLVLMLISNSSWWIGKRSLKATNMSIHIWEIKNRPHDAVLNGLPEMQLSAQQLVQTLRDSSCEGGVPFGRLPSPKQFNLPIVKHLDLFVR